MPYRICLNLMSPRSIKMPGFGVCSDVRTDFNTDALANEAGNAGKLQ